MAKKGKNHLKGTRVYLSGPMDFVASRAAEKKYGWRTRVSQFLKFYGVTALTHGTNRRFGGFTSTAERM